MFERKVFYIFIIFGLLINTFLLSKELYPYGQSQQVADSLYQATIFDKAALKYVEMIKTLEKNSEAWGYAVNRLTLSYYYSGQYREIVDFFKHVDFSDITNTNVENLLIETLFFQGASLNKVKDYENASSTLQSYLAKRGRFSLVHERDAIFELGISYFLSKKYKQAKEIFISFSSNDRAGFYLAYIALNLEEFEEAEVIISKLLQKSLSEELFFALTYLRGEIFYRQSNFINAIKHFELVKQPISGKIDDWYLDSLHHMGLCYFNLALKATSKQITEQYFDKAELAFNKLLNLSQNENIYLSLGKTYLMRGKLLGDVAQFEKLENLLVNKDLFLSLDTQHLAIMLRAEAKDKYGEKKQLLHQLTRSNNKGNTSFAKATYLQGLNEFEEGQRLLQEVNEQQRAKKHLETASLSLSKAFDGLYPDDIFLAALAMKYQIETLAMLQNRDAYKKGLEIIDKMLNDYRQDLFAAVDNQDEIYYFQGLIAAKLFEIEEESKYFDITINSLNHVIASYPKKKYFLDSIYLLASFYYKSGQFAEAEKTFVDFTRFDSSARSGDALFFASLASEKQKKDPLITKEYRKRVFENFPESSLADEAYFRQFSFNEYMQSDSLAIKHLKNLEEKFPSSPFIISANYLLGMIHLHDRDLSSDYFKMTETVFDKLAKNGAINDNRLNYFSSVRYFAMLDSAINNIDLSQDGKIEKYLDAAEKILTKIYFEFDKLGEFNRLFEKCSYHLAKCYILQNKAEMASDIFTKMLDKYDETKITKGYYLSRLHFERGMVKFNIQEYSQALNSFERAKETSKGAVLSSDELLDLWIQEAMCYLNLNDLDRAMLLLSNVINYESASHMRIRAMYLRSTVYKKQGRGELAKNQLEAVAKKSGIWAKKAKEKLGKNYVIK